jgi:cytochrome c oxidase subunit I
MALADTEVASHRVVIAEASPVHRELAAWAGLAVSALGIAGVFALLLAVSRVPGVETIFPWPIGFFAKGLVIHVVFSFVVWFLAAFATLAVAAAATLTDASSPGTPLMLAPPLAAAIGLPLLFVPALRDAGEATLNNYIPVIIDPLYYFGLLLIAAAVASVALRLVLRMRVAAWRKDPLAAALAAAGAAYLAALAAFAIARSALAGTSLDDAFNEHLMWGGGHILQFVNTILVAVAWGTLARLATGDRIGRLTTIAKVSALLGMLGVLALLIYAVYPAFSDSQMKAFTWLQYALGSSAAVVICDLGFRLPRPVDWRHPAMRCLWLSIVVFGVGAALGLFVDGADTRTPAHYHGVIAGVSLALMGVFLFVVLPMLGRRAPSERRAAWTLGLFGWGQLAACVGLFIAGGHGTPRKIAGEAQGLVDLPAYAGMALNGIGGLVAIVGGALFVWTVATALLASPVDEKDTVRPRPAL